eukprot:328695-Ditylum_brightwellii.AAC.1
MSCANGSALFQLSLTTDDWAQEISWLLVYSDDTMFFNIKVSALLVSWNIATRNAYQKAPTSFLQYKIHMMMSSTILMVMDPIPLCTTALKLLPTETLDFLQHTS